ncbi:DUF6478 family protein [Ruegeria lacuscaerulensis]|uniref:DUF6478 family protein n=1 Tax=Ruegeria lacuscaerulensis TaxID=55218 RepID=UPI00147CBDC2|nr:DUF6478 family protein [Ruegeria lacuscaerulensis]
MGKFLDRYIFRKVQARWRQAAQMAGHTPPAQLRHQRDEARKLRADLDRLIHAADGRLTRPLIGSNQFAKPLGTDWSWRPDLWREPLSRSGLASAPRRTPLDGQTTLFHDCALSEISLRQTRNRRDNDLAPFGLSLEVFEFAGSFLSLSVALPADAAQGLTKQHLIRVDAQIEAERDTHGMARLNIQHGPNTEQVLRELDPNRTGGVDFDLAHLPLNERRIDKIWLDLIFDAPTMNRIFVRELTFCRHHRADL